MSAAIKGTSAVGKSAMVNRVLNYFPPEDVIGFSALSEKALFYWPGVYAHKILSMGEAMNGRAVEFQDCMIRQLISEGKLTYPVSQKIDGEIQTTVVEKNGPVTFVITTTKNALHPENETRLLSLELSDSAEATERAMQMIAEVHGLNADTKDNYSVWQDFQRWLGAGERRVYVPFAPELAELIPAKAVRVRRDLAQLISAIKAHALLHRQHRKRDQGEIVATIEDDYAAVRPLMAALIDEASEAKVGARVLETVAAVEAAEPASDDGAKVLEIAHKLKVDRYAARRRLQKAEALGLISNLETRPRQPSRYKVAERGEEGTHASMLPTVEKLQEAFEKALAAEKREGDGAK
jgi:hypothetical protein